MHPKANSSIEDKKLTPDEDLQRHYSKIATLCNDSGLEQDTQTGKWIVKGDPTEGALVVAAEKAGINKENLDRATNHA